MQIELIVGNGGTLYYPTVCSGITVDWSRKGTPGKISFSVLQDDVLKIEEGNSIKLSVDGTGFFHGFVFTKQRDKENILKITAYDQLRYLKNKETYNYSNKTAGDVIKMIAEDFLLESGELEDTQYIIPARVEEETTLFDIIQNAINETLEMTRKLYVFYDDVGKLTLKNINNMKLNILIDEETAQNFDYTSSIDSGTYNQIKVVQTDTETSEKKVAVLKSGESIARWGVLQLNETVQDLQNMNAKAEALLGLYNAPTKSVSVTGAVGDLRVRAGCSVVVNLKLGDDEIKQRYMVVENVTHTFEENLHTMNLKLIGGEFVV